jgi:hypothetical protein
LSLIVPAEENVTFSSAYRSLLELPLPVAAASVSDNIFAELLSCPQD